MAINRSGKVKQLNVRIPNDLHEKLMLKCYSEGYSLQEAITLLINLYLRGRIG